MKSVKIRLSDYCRERESERERVGGREGRERFLSLRYWISKQWHGE